MSNSFYRWVLCAALAAVVPLPSSAAEPQLLWKTNVGARVYTSPVVCDLLPSPGLEAVVCASEERQVVCLSATGQRLWSFGEGFSARLTSTPSVADLDGDGRPEIVVAGGGGDAGANVVCLDAQGKQLWRARLEGEVDWSAPVVADLDADGLPEITVGTRSGFVFCLSAHGAILWRVKLGDGASGLIAAADVNGDGKKEVCAAADRTLFCLDSSGRTLWEASSPTACNGASIGDLDGDGALEIVAAYDDQTLYRLDRDGRLVWAYHGGYSGGGATGFAPPCLGDLDGDGALEIVVGDFNGGVRCLDSGGKERWYVNFGRAIGDPPVVGDVDGDGEIEVVAGFEDGSLVCLNRTPAVEWRCMTDFRSPFPSLGDIDGDGRVEVLAASNDNSVYCLRAPGAGRAGRLPWPLRRHDLAQTGAVVASPDYS